MEIENNNTELVCCCGCGQDLRISREEANEWHDVTEFLCSECE